jgi:hypothetical protein
MTSYNNNGSEAATAEQSWIQLYNTMHILHRALPDMTFQNPAVSGFVLSNSVGARARARFVI